MLYLMTHTAPDLTAIDTAAVPAFELVANGEPFLSGLLTGDPETSFTGMWRTFDVVTDEPYLVQAGESNGRPVRVAQVSVSEAGHVIVYVTKQRKRGGDYVAGWCTWHTAASILDDEQLAELRPFLAAVHVQLHLAEIDAAERADDAPLTLRELRDERDRLDGEADRLRGVRSIADAKFGPNSVQVERAVTELRAVIAKRDALTSRIRRAMAAEFGHGNTCDERSGVDGSSGFFCTRDADHEGDHVAHGEKDRAVATWPRDVAAVHVQLHLAEIDAAERTPTMSTENTPTVTLAPQADGRFRVFEASAIFTWPRNGLRMRLVTVGDFGHEGIRVRAIPQRKNGGDYANHRGVWVNVDALPDEWNAAVLAALAAHLPAADAEQAPAFCEAAAEDDHDWHEGGDGVTRCVECLTIAHGEPVAERASDAAAHDGMAADDPRVVADEALIAAAQTHYAQRMGRALRVPDDRVDMTKAATTATSAVLAIRAAVQYRADAARRAWLAVQHDGKRGERWAAARERASVLADVLAEIDGVIAARLS